MSVAGAAVRPLPKALVHAYTLQYKQQPLFVPIVLWEAWS